MKRVAQLVWWGILGVGEAVVEIVAEAMELIIPGIVVLVIVFGLLYAGYSLGATS